MDDVVEYDEYAPNKRIRFAQYDWKMLCNFCFGNVSVDPPSAIRKSEGTDEILTGSFSLTCTLCAVVYHKACASTSSGSCPSCYHQSVEAFSGTCKPGTVPPVLCPAVNTDSATAVAAVAAADAAAATAADASETPTPATGAFKQPQSSSNHPAINFHPPIPGARPSTTPLLKLSHDLFTSNTGLVSSSSSSSTTGTPYPEYTPSLNLDEAVMSLNSLASNTCHSDYTGGGYNRLPIPTIDGESDGGGGGAIHVLSSDANTTAGRSWKTCGVNGCEYKTKMTGNLKQHKANVHNIDIVWHPCTEIECGYRAKRKGDLNKHLAQIHNIGVTWHPCGEGGCLFRAKRKDTLNIHKSHIHNIGVRWHPCTEIGCEYRAKEKGTLTQHKARVHNIAVTWHVCTVDGCTYKTSWNSDLTKHKAHVHDIGAKWLSCPNLTCNFQTKQRRNLINHQANIHGIDLRAASAVQALVKTAMYQAGVQDRKNAEAMASLNGIVLPPQESGGDLDGLVALAESIKSPADLLNDLTASLLAGRGVQGVGELAGVQGVGELAGVQAASPPMQSNQPYQPYHTGAISASQKYTGLY